MRTWLTADLHFFHEAVLGYATRPCSSVAEMHDALIDAWRSSVGPRDRVFVLGDFAFATRQREAELRRIFDQLPGERHLVRGNHDNGIVLDLPWASVTDMDTVRHEGKRLFVCHYPLLSWPHMRDRPHAHGHSHGNLSTPGPLTRRVDVGVDASWPREQWGQPLRFFTVYDAAMSRRAVTVDHH